MLQADLLGLGKHHQCRKLSYQWMPMSHISPHVAAAVIASEDQFFTQHWGFDLNAIGQVLEGGEKRGASTVSQQVAKNLFLWPERSWLRKGLEAYFTIWIELLWDKRRIMEVYLNTAQFGPCTFGVVAAARYYFGKQASALLPFESALLATVLPNPYQMNPARPSAYMLERAYWIEAQIAQLTGSAYLMDW